MATGPASERQVGRKWWIASFLGGGRASDEAIASSGIAFHLWRLYQHFWLVCLLFPLVTLVRAPGHLSHLVLGLGALVFFAASYTWLMWPHPVRRAERNRAQFHRQLGLFVVLVALVLVLSFAEGLSLSP